MEECYLLGVRYCSNKMDPIKKAKPEFRTLVSKCSDEAIIAALRSRSM